MATTPVNPEAQAITDLQAAVSAVGTAIAAEVVALQAAMNAQGVNNTPAIEASVQKIKDLTVTLNQSLAAPPPPPPPAVPVLTALSPTSGPAAGGTSVTLTGPGFTGATAVTFSSIPAKSFRNSSRRRCGIGGSRNRSPIPGIALPLAPQSATLNHNRGPRLAIAAVSRERAMGLLCFLTSPISRSRPSLLSYQETAWHNPASLCTPIPHKLTLRRLSFKI
jgi:hypothetical protein